MATYQCLFFTEQRVGYWENLEADAEHSIEALLQEKLTEGEWEAAEAWRDDVLICRAVRVGSA